MACEEQPGGGPVEGNARPYMRGDAEEGPGPSTIPRTTIMPSSRPQICTDSSISRDSRISRSAIGISDRVVEFQDWLRHHRGISERTVDRHGRMVMRLLPRLGDDPAT
jgi:hypothetical protein